MCDVVEAHSCVELSNNTTVIALTISTRRLTKTSGSKRPASEYMVGNCVTVHQFAISVYLRVQYNSMCICGYTLLSQIVSHTAKAHYKTWRHCIP